jgi:hypothetical protein
MKLLSDSFCCDEIILLLLLVFHKGNAWHMAAPHVPIFGLVRLGELLTEEGCDRPSFIIT